MNVHSFTPWTYQFACIQIYIDTLFKIYSDGNVFKIRGVYFKVIYFNDNQSLSSTFKRNIFLTKILTNAPLKDSESAITTAGKYKPIHYNTHRNRTTTSPYEWKILEWNEKPKTSKLTNKTSILSLFFLFSRWSLITRFWKFKGHLPPSPLPESANSPLENTLKLQVHVIPSILWCLKKISEENIFYIELFLVWCFLWVIKNDNCCFYQAL